MTRPLILITNDDGIQAKGIRTLVDVASKYGEVVVVAPNKSYSAKSHAMTICAPLESVPYNSFSNATAYMVAGTPVDCVKLALNLLVQRRPDLILSGINHGTNASSSVHYSGTIGAAREAALLGIKGIGFSLDDFDDDADFSVAARVADNLIGYFLKSNLPTNDFYNVDVPVGEIKGLKVCRAANSHWREDADHFLDPWGKDYYWLKGNFINDEPDATDTDLYWLQQGYATLTPCKLDFNDYELIEKMKQEKLI